MVLTKMNNSRRQIDDNLELINDKLLFLYIFFKVSRSTIIAGTSRRKSLLRYIASWIRIFAFITFVTVLAVMNVGFIGLDQSDNSAIRILTYNIHHGADAADKYDIDAIIATIKNSGANIIALQEVDRVRSIRSQYSDQARYIAERLGMNYAFGPALDSVPGVPGMGEYGLMILSKFPIVAERFYLLPSALEQRGVLWCKLRTPYGFFQVGCTHLGVSVTERFNQITAILNLLPVGDDFLILGDFNAPPQAEELKLIQSRFVDLPEQYGLGGVGTILYQDQWTRIDYIFGSGCWSPVDCRVMPEQTSDHLPVYAELKLYKISMDSILKGSGREAVAGGLSVH
jgi:endonuclease/exonuclease/phosphatase family metal-dependent hydrolase